MKVSLLTGGGEPHYIFGLLSGLISKDIFVDFIGNDQMRTADILKSQNLIYYNLRGDQNQNAPIQNKITRVLKYYFKLLKYATETNSKLFHIQWLNKFIYFDRTLLNIYYKLLGKKLVFTAHNIDQQERDGKSTLINRLTLKFMYQIVDHIIVHTEQMKLQLIEGFNIRENKITVIPHGINNMVPRSKLTIVQARNKLYLRNTDKTILFFGNIAPYKGLEYLVLAFVELKEKYDENFRLIIAGQIKNCEGYWEIVERIIEEHDLKNYIIKRIGFIPDKEIEVYFKSADVLVLPYRRIFQTGVTFLSYSFGLPVIAPDVGSLREDIVDGETGFICQPENPQDLAKKIDMYFHSHLFKNFKANRNKIIKYTNKKYSWKKIGQKTYALYENLL